MPSTHPSPLPALVHCYDYFSYITCCYGRFAKTISHRRLLHLPSLCLCKRVGDVHWVHRSSTCMRHVTCCECSPTVCIWLHQWQRLSLSPAAAFNRYELLWLFLPASYRRLSPNCRGYFFVNCNWHHQLPQLLLHRLCWASSAVVFLTPPPPSIAVCCRVRLYAAATSPHHLLWLIL